MSGSLWLHQIKHDGFAPAKRRAVPGNGL